MFNISSMRMSYKDSRSAKKLSAGLTSLWRCRPMTTTATPKFLRGRPKSSSGRDARSASTEKSRRKIRTGTGLRRTFH